MGFPMILPSCSLPDHTKPTIDFLDSSFFRTHIGQTLPSPAEVRARSSSKSPQPRHSPVVFPELKLLVKFGTDIAVTEAQNLWAIRRIFGASIPVPEIYGWRCCESEVFIYIQLIEGHVLRDQWPSLTKLEKEDVCSQLKSTLALLRQVKQDPSDQFIGSLDSRSLLDFVFEREPHAGPFPSIKCFHNWFALLPMKNLPEKDRYPHPYRSYLPDDGKITLTHADFHWGNIIITSSSPPKVVAILDWEQTGWYPDYWEFCKACHTSKSDGEWRLEYLPRILEVRDEEHIIYTEFIYAMGVFL